MSIVQRKSRSGATVYWVVVTWKGRRVWERAGTVEREAVALEKKNKREIKAGTFQPKQSSRVSVGAYIETWAATRSNVNAGREMNLLDRHIVNRPGFSEIPINAVSPSDMLDLIESLKNTISDETGEKLSIKHVANIYGLVRKAMRDARVREIIYSDPCEPVRAGLTQKGKRAHPIYSVDEVAAFLSADVEPDIRVWNALAFFTGMRTGEICGRKFRDYDARSKPLGALEIETQYADRKLKTDRIRKAPVHPELARALEWWRREGFEYVYRRKPEANDYVVPHRDDYGARPHTESSAYKQWMRACAQAGVQNRAGKHTTRHTFITMCRRGGADRDVVRLVTHNPKGDMIDQYTHLDWAPLCDAVGSLTESLTGVSVSQETSCRRRESKSRPTEHDKAYEGIVGEDRLALSTENSPGVVRSDADRGASLRSEILPPVTISGALAARFFRFQSHRWLSAAEASEGGR